MPDRFRASGVTAIEILPKYYRDTDDYLELERFCEIIDIELEEWDRLLEELAASRRIDTSSSEQLNYLYAEQNVPPPDMVTENKRREVLMQMAVAYKGKGDLTVLRDMIVLLVDHAVEINSFWSNSRYWRIGHGTVGHMDIGRLYRAKRSSAFTIGSAKIGSTSIEKDTQGKDTPYTFQIRLNRKPDAAEIRAVTWAANLLKRSEDHFVIWYPPIATWWTINDSKIGIDSIVASRGWIIGHSKIGLSTRIVNSTPPAPSYIIDPFSQGTWVPFYGGGIWHT